MEDTVKSEIQSRIEFLKLNLKLDSFGNSVQAQKNKTLINWSESEIEWLEKLLKK